MAIVLKGGNIVTAVDTYTADVRIVGDKIVCIGDNLGEPGDEIINVQGSYVMPGGIDTHTHFDLDVGSTVTADNFESGTRAAIAGGTTTILDYACQYKGESLKTALEGQHKKSQGVCYCDYGFHMGITDWNESVSEEMKEMIEAGVTSFKLYMAYKGNLQVDDSVIFKALKRSKEVGGLIGFHCENGDIIDELIKESKKKGEKAPIFHALARPVEVEKEAITRVLNIAEIAKAPVYVVHLSSKEGLLTILDAKKRGAEVYVESCPQYLMLDDSLYGDKSNGNFEGAKYVMSPPLRKEEDQRALWEGLQSGEIITLGTDHCSFNFKGQKDIGIDDFSKIPNGAPGVENRMQLMYTYGVLTGKITINQMVALTSTNGAKLFGVFPEKGTIAVGSDADIMVLNPNYKSKITAETQIQKVDYNPYEGFDIRGKIEYVFLRGSKVVANSELVDKKPTGKYLSRRPFLGR